MWELRGGGQEVRTKPICCLYISTATGDKKRTPDWYKSCRTGRWLSNSSQQDCCSAENPSAPFSASAASSLPTISGTTCGMGDLGCCCAPSTKYGGNQSCHDCYSSEHDHNCGYGCWSCHSWTRKWTSTFLKCCQSK